MYEGETHEVILDRMLKRVSDKFDKREGSILWDTHSPTAFEFQLLYIELDTILREAYGDTASREFLIRRCKERGIAPDDLEKVKQKFFKAKNSVRGSGIGLAVVDEIVQTLGGRFEIASTLGQGTTVTVTLPIYHPGQEHLHEKI